MKQFLAFLIVFPVIAACSGKQELLPIVAAPQGTTSSGGGDPYESEFRDVARGILRRIRAERTEELEGISTVAFEKAAGTLSFSSTDAQLKQDGKIVDAINYPAEQRVKLSTVRWPTMSEFTRRRLVVHEIFGLMGIADPEYKKSCDFLAELGFLSKVQIYKFSLSGEVARTLIDKIEWKKEEIAVEERLDSDFTRTVHTTYTAPRPELPKHWMRDPELDKNYIVCEHYDFIDRETAKRSPPLDICVLSPFFAYAGDGGSFFAQLDEGEADPLLRLFYGSGGRFDYGLIKGDYYSHPEIEFLPWD